AAARQRAGLVDEVPGDTHVRAQVEGLQGRGAGFEAVNDLPDSRGALADVVRQRVNGAGADVAAAEPRADVLGDVDVERHVDRAASGPGHVFGDEIEGLGFAGTGARLTHDNAAGRGCLAECFLLRSRLHKYLDNQFGMGVRGG